jgi:hypothetical protein
MDERETNVYMAKLSEQAERYDGTAHFLAIVWPQLMIFVNRYRLF